VNTISEAAIALKVKPGTLRRLCRQGMPHQPGGKGRGKACMIDIAVARRWIEGSADDRAVLQLAGELPQLLARSIFATWQKSYGPHKNALAGALAGVWYLSTNTLVEYLRECNSQIPKFDGNPPEEIQHLRKIAQKL
jgi:hypothetical protein